MKHILLAIILLPSIVLAHSPPPEAPGGDIHQRFGPQSTTKSLPDNYQVTLTITDNDVQPLELSVVVASPQFTASLGEYNLNFTGSVTVEENGIIITYGLGWHTPEPTVNGSTPFKRSTMQGSVRLKLGEEVQIIRAGSRMARLSIKKLEASKPK